MGLSRGTPRIRRTFYLENRLLDALLLRLGNRGILACACVVEHGIGIHE